LKKTLIITFLLFSVTVKATNYYVKNNGNDNNTGQSDAQAWATIAKVNSSFSSFSAGDQILFNRGNIFYGTIIISKSGISGNPITIGAYGTGADPVISGFTTISGWTDQGGNIYSKIIASAAQTNMVTIDGVNTGLGRYPDATYLSYESCVTNTTITDTGLGDATDWAGAEAVIRKNDWTIDRCLITDHTGDVLTYKNLETTQNANPNYGYFIQNDLRTLTVTNEWYHDIGTGKFYIYGNPDAKIVKAATIQNLFYNNGYDYITIHDLSFEGAIKDAIYFGSGSDHYLIQNCKIAFAAGCGIKNGGTNGTIDNNIISNCAGAGLMFPSGGSNVNITNNTITKIGKIVGQSMEDGGYEGIILWANNCLVQHNNIENIGYVGIDIGPNALTTTVKNNYINNVCSVLNDGGGIYLSGPRTSVLIDSNIVLNSIGNIDGSATHALFSMGIYLDELSYGVKVTNNTVAHCSGAGYLLNKAHDNIISNNLSFDNANGIMYSNWTNVHYLYNNVISGNIFFGKAASQYVATFGRSTADDIFSFGTSDNNYYARPIADNNDFYINYNYGGHPEEKHTLAEWQALTSQDANSRQSPISVSDTSKIDFYYNATKTNKLFTLVQPMIDVKGAKYANSITLLPFASVVLMVDSNPASPGVPSYTGSVIGNATSSLLEITYNISLSNIVPPSSAFSVQVNSVARAVNSVAVSGSKVLLTLASPVVYGNVVTVAYIQPAGNPLQSTTGGYAASMSSQVVTNNVAAPALPVYINSSIENITPGLLELVYNLSLAAIVPNTSAFIVRVNSVIRPISSVAVSGTKVQLTLASPAAYGDIITVDYTEPSTNQLQTASGGQAASFIAQSVTNRVTSPTLPTYISSSISNSTPSLIEMTYNLTLANLIPSASAFSVHVNASVRTVNAVSVSGTRVQLTLASPVFYGDVVTLSYIKPAGNPLQTATGGTAASISNQPVTNNRINIAPGVVITSPVINSSFTSPANINITANATDADGSIIMVEFYSGISKIGTISAAPYSFAWNNVSMGTYSLTAVATDNYNLKTVSSAISISVNNGTTSGNKPPVIKISNPSKGNKFDNPATITIDADASDSDGTITKVEFYSGAQKLGEVTTEPFTYTWKDVKSGNYIITAVATDNLNATTTSLPIEFEVGNISEFDAKSDVINLYPNPNDGHFSIEFVNPLQNDKSNLVITDLSGKQVYNDVVLKEETIKHIDLSYIRSGIYILMIIYQKILVTKKFIIH